MKTAFRMIVAVAILAGCGVGLYLWFDEYKKPTIRTEVNEPLFTVAGADYSKALSEGKKVVEFGPLPGSAFYAGGLAFKQPEEALVWLKSTGKYDKGWRVFELTGDFEMDTHLVRGLPYTNKTLLVSREVQLQP